MKGLDKIIARIESDAEKECEEMLAAASGEAERIKAEYDGKIAEVEAEYAERTEREAEAVITRAKSSAAMTRRNIISGQKSRGVDMAYEEAHRQLLDMPRDEYASLLIVLAVSAIRSHATKAEERKTQYGEDIGAVKYELVFNPRDREEFGEAIVLTIKNNYKRAVGADAAKRVVLADGCADIDGGVIVRAGAVEENCSLSLLLESLRETLDPVVYKTLYPEN